jgi:hypothetical protein
MATEEVLVYDNGGSVFGGRRAPQSLEEWKKEGRERKKRWMYKGYHPFGGVTYSVVVYDNEKWDAKELARRKENGFLGIKVYRLGSGKR